MSDKDKERPVVLGEYMIAHGSTVRATAAHFGISKSTVHKDLSERLRKISPTLFREVKKILEENKQQRHIRGGMATKLKYERQHMLLSSSK